MEARPTKKPKHPKKKKHHTEATFNDLKEETPTSKKRKAVDCENHLLSDENDFAGTERKKKKKKRHAEEVQQNSINSRLDDNHEEETEVRLFKKEKKKQKKKKSDKPRDTEETVPLEAEILKAPKKKKVRESSDQACNQNGLEMNAGVSLSCSPATKTEYEGKTVTGVTMNSEIDLTNKIAVNIKHKKKKKKKTKDESYDVGSKNVQEAEELSVNNSIAEEKSIVDETVEIEKKKKKKKKRKRNEDEKPFVASDASEEMKKVSEDNSLLGDKTNVDETDNMKKKKKKKKTKDTVEEIKPCDTNHVPKEQELSDPPNKCGQWQGEMFDSSERQNKFLRLLGGMKKTPTSQNKELNPKRLFGGGTKSGEKKKGLFGSLSLSFNSTSYASTALTTTDADNLNQKLEDEYNRAMNFKLGSKKGIGLGFTPDPAENKKFHIDVNKTNSLKFDD